MTTDRSALQVIAAGREAEILEWDDRSVVRLYRTARHPLAVAHEVAAMEAVRATLPVVPRVVGIVDVAGRPGIVMERVDGPDLLTAIGREPDQAVAGGGITAEVQALIHDVVAPAPLPDLRVSIAARLSRPSVPPAIASRALALLEGLPDGDQLCHGDLHPGNILLSPHGPMVIDWQNATRGDPAADFTRTRVLLACGELPPGVPDSLRAVVARVRQQVRQAHEETYRRCRALAPDRSDRWLYVMAASRLADEVEGERALLLGLLATGLDG